MTYLPTLTTIHSVIIVVINPNPLTPAHTHTVHMLTCMCPIVNKQPSKHYQYIQPYKHTLTHNLYYTNRESIFHI